MAKNKSNTKKSVELQNSKHFYFVGNNSNILCVGHTRFFTNLPSYINAMSRLFVLQSGRLNDLNVLAKLILTLVSLLSLHNSKLVAQLHRESTFLHVPNFIMPIITRICLKSVSSNKVSGYTTGMLETDLTFEQLILSILNADLDTWSGSLHPSKYAALVQTQGDLDRLRNVIIGQLKAAGLNVDVPHSETEPEFHDIQLSDNPNILHVEEVEESFIYESKHISFSKTLPEIVSFLLGLYTSIFRYNDKIEYYSDYLDYEIVTDLSIFRFRNFEINTHFIVQQNMISTPNSEIIDFYATFLRIFEPTFPAIGAVHIAGDIVLSVESVPLEEAWTTYLSHKVEKQSKSKGKSNFPNKGRKPGDKPGGGKALLNVGEDVPANPNIGNRNFSTLNSNTSLIMVNGSGGIQNFKFSRFTTRSHESYTITKRSYHSTSHRRGLFELFGIVKSAAPSPPIAKVFGHIMKAASTSISTSIYDPVFYGGLFGTLLAGSILFTSVYCYSKAVMFYEILSFVSQIKQNQALVNLLMDSIPELTDFNLNAAKLLYTQSSHLVSLEDCELLVRWCIKHKVHKIKEVLVDTSNLLLV